MRHLDDRELDLLLRAANDEARRRGRFSENRDAVPVATGVGLARKEAAPPRSQTRQRKFKLAASALDAGAGERCASRLQGGHKSSKDCSAVRLGTDGCAQGAVRTEAMK